MVPAAGETAGSHESTRLEPGGEGPRNAAAHLVFNTVPALPGTRGKQRVELAVVSCPIGPRRVGVEPGDQCRAFCWRQSGSGSAAALPLGSTFLRDLRAG